MAAVARACASGYGGVPIPDRAAGDQVPPEVHVPPVLSIHTLMSQIQMQETIMS